MRPLLLLLLASAAASAKPLPLERFDAASFSISVPKGWKASTQNMMVIAQQDPADATSPAIVFSVEPTKSSVTEDAILDMIAAQVVTENLKPTRRDAAPGGGRLLRADGTNHAGLKLRLAAIANAGAVTTTICVVVSKLPDFDATGGLDLAAAIMASYQVTSKIDTPLAHGLTLADLVGEWFEDDGSIQALDRAGKLADYRVAGSRHTITAKGALGGTSSGSVSVSNLATKGTVLELGLKSGARRYVVESWFVAPELTVLGLNGPWSGDHDPAKPARVYWIRKTKAKLK